MSRKKPEFVEVQYDVKGPVGITWKKVTGKALPRGSFAYRHVKRGHWAIDHMEGRFLVLKVEGKEGDAQGKVLELEGYKAQAEQLRRDNPDQRNLWRKGKKRNGQM